ncbi:PH domain-containing protein [Halovivax gelatinilyticus]|uniref:PH domain-containing protein n=1 Tax=Halovivax gelatinilyticus TaxID=2961597 RepID=UPI0020CA8CA1|nr:PH domain-containing protein [Halovivax gelatinilyticus]
MNRLHPLSAVFLALNRGVAGLFILFFLTSIVGGAIDVPFTGLPIFAAAIGFFLGAAYGVAYYYRFGYELRDDTFDIASGVISRRSREIPYRRIQNVDIRQGVLFQLLGFATVTIETAGGGGSEGSLNFVSEDEAATLQHDIRKRTATATNNRKAARSRDSEAGVESSEPAREAETDREVERSVKGPDGPADADVSPDDPTRAYDRPGSPDADPVRPDDARRESDAAFDTGYRTRKLFALNSRELLLYSFASFRPAALAAAGFLLFFGGEALLRYFLLAAQPLGGPETIGAGTTSSYLVLSAVSMVHAVAITYLLSVLYSFVSYYGFRLGKAGDDLVYERGLLQRYSGSIPLEKVQSVTISDNPIQRYIEYAGLWVETAGYGPDSNGGSQSAVPLARLPRVHQFTERLTEIEPPTFERPTTVARRRYLARFTIVVTVLLVLAAVTSVVVDQFQSWWLVAALYVFVPPAAHLKWKHLGYYVGEDHLVIREGFWQRRTTVIPYYRVQTVSTRRSIFQRRLGLASLVVDTASSRTFFWSTPTIHDIDLAVSRSIHETTRERLQVALAERGEDDSIPGERL